MANPKIIEQKSKTVEDIKAKFEAAQSVVLMDYRGLTVEEAVALRNSFRQANVEYVVLKNSMVQRAARQLGYEELMPQLIGPSAFAFGVDDLIAPARIMKDFIKKSRKCEIKGGVINGKVENAQAINAIADLPPREVLLARLLGSMKAPISGLAIALDRIREKMEGGQPDGAGA